MTSAQKLICILKEKNMKITFAESCTGGAMSASIVDVSGASSVFEYGFVTYSSEAKINTLGVSKETTSKYGVVSCETAKEMAKGAIEKSSATISISVTGCAGPGKDNEGNDAGTICLGYCVNGITIAEKVTISGNSRNEIRKNTVDYAFERICQFIDNLLQPWEKIKSQNQTLE